MNNKSFKLIKRKFILYIVGITVLSVIGFGIILYQSNTIRFNQNISSGDLNSLVSENPSVVEYLEEEKQFEAHFITIANLVKQEQQNNLGNALIIIAIPVLFVSGLLGYLVARKLLNPVKDSFESQERFLQDAAHELRNPLAAISASLQNAPSQLIKTNFYNTVKRQTKRLVGINEDLLFLEKRNFGNKIKNINISDLTEDILEDMQPSIVFKKIKIKSDIQNGVVRKVDSNDYVRMVKNVISNAIKYTPKGGNVNIKLSGNNSDTVIEISDSGIGIPKAEQENIGNRFYRAKNVGDISGTGLGMSIVIKVLNSYGGNLKITSQINKGTTVILKF